ncbi:hypothetical protein [Micromonospora chersina]|uniref:hypothetical protein n=1 Tax=Micromonospora chersina TaxID=47854 RepID=UPI00339F3265
MTDSMVVAQLAKKIADLEERTKAVERGPQLAHSSIEAGTLEVFDEAGASVLQMGRQDDGTYAIVGTNGGKVVADTVPQEVIDQITADLELADGGVTEAKLAAGAVTETKIADDSISTEKVIAGAIQTLQLAADAVAAGKIAADAVTAREIKALAVTAEKIAANAITASKIAAGAITTDKLPSRTSRRWPTASTTRAATWPTGRLSVASPT